MKRILFLADMNSSHTQKWVVSLAAKGFEIGLFSLSTPESDWYSGIQNLAIFERPGFSSKMFSVSTFEKIAFLKALPALKRAIRNFQPDILHAHYATSYGLLGRLSGFHPYYISVWGSDLFEFPQKSFVHKAIVRNNLRSAERIFSTSKVIEAEVVRISGRTSEIIPFGIDMNRFRPMRNTGSRKEGTLVIGTIKSLEKHYCIDVLMKAFSKVRIEKQNLKLRLLIIGSGTQEANLKQLAKDLNIEDVTEFRGRVAFDRIPSCHNEIDIFVNLSAHESFGVSVLEASACCRPVIVTDTGGLREVVSENKTGFLVPVRDVTKTAACISRLIDDRQLAVALGEEGRKFVSENYDWELCLKKTIDSYLKM